MLKPRFQIGQIVSLTQGNTRLYAEVIQLADRRDLCWIRPIVLEMESLADLSAGCVTSWRSPTPSTLIDLRDGIDLFVPPTVLQSTLDVEFIPLLVHLAESTLSTSDSYLAKEYLRQFVHQLCQQIQAENDHSTH